jgi:CRP-like cAMP-binding protein
MALEADVRHLSRIPTFAVLDFDALRLLAVGAETVTLRRGEVLFRRDEASDGGFVLISGAIALDPGEFGQGEQLVRPPTLIGDMALITKTRRPATAIAREPSTLLKISRQLFHRMLNDSPTSAERLKRILSDQLLAFMRDLDGIMRNEEG